MLLWVAWPNGSSRAAGAPGPRALPGAVPVPRAPHPGWRGCGGERRASAARPRRMRGQPRERCRRGGARPCPARSARPPNRRRRGSSRSQRLVAFVEPAGLQCTRCRGPARAPGSNGASVVARGQARPVSRFGVGLAKGIVQWVAGRVRRRCPGRPRPHPTAPRVRGGFKRHPASDRVRGLNDADGNRGGIGIQPIDPSLQLVGGLGQHQARRTRLAGGEGVVERGDSTMADLPGRRRGRRDGSTEGPRARCLGVQLNRAAADGRLPRPRPTAS